jgi:hypothetical protein
MPLTTTARNHVGGAGGPSVHRRAQDPLVPASYCSTTLAGMRPRSLTAMPWSLAQARDDGHEKLALAHFW